MAKNIARSFLLLTCLSWFTQPAFAYLDPGTASMLLQGLIGGLAAGAAVISLNFQRFKFAVSRLLSKGSDKANH